MDAVQPVAHQEPNQSREAFWAPGRAMGHEEILPFTKDTHVYHEDTSDDTGQDHVSATRMREEHRTGSRSPGASFVARIFVRQHYEQFRNPAL